MARWHKETETRLRFITGNVYRRIPLFRRPEFCNVFLESLDYCRRKHGVGIHAFVIMPDHFHLLISVSREGVLSDFLRDCKGFTAHSILKTLRKRGNSNFLQVFRAPDPKRRRDSHFRIFQPDTHVEGISSKRFFLQKLDYIHNNPVKAGLAENVVEYRFSSARGWLLGDHSLLRLDPVD
jgi:REP element-mobilizing transposase RayT